MPKLFGTDGIRGVAATELTGDLANRIGRAAATWLRKTKTLPRVVVARDTRLSGPSLEEALVSGLCSGGADVMKTGVLPTPAVAYLVNEWKADSGIVISASHNPVEYNGIKFFSSEGFKLSELQEDEIEAALDLEDEPAVEAGRVSELEEAENSYIVHAIGTLGGQRLDGMKVVLDCAFGASHRISPRTLQATGAEVIALNDQPDGSRINANCGSTYPEVAANQTVKDWAHLGLSLDGDADRVIAVDESGQVVDGDSMLAALAIGLKERDQLAGNAVAATVMANLGFRQAMRRAGIEVVETDVGDRYVVEAMRRQGVVLGGEQSGHIVMLDHATTGDGLIVGLQLMALMKATGRPLSELASVVEKFPQELINVPVERKEQLDKAEKVTKAVKEMRRKLGDSGRVLVRASGTEPVIRVMVEATDQAVTEAAANEIAEVVRKELGGADKQD